MILHAIRACNKAETVDKVVVATSDHPSDDPLYEYLRGVYTEGCAWYRGSLTNVLERTYEAAKQEGASHVVRITADCPLVDYRNIDRIHDAYRQNGVYYGFTNSPDGNDVEVFSMEVLGKALLYASTDEREHTTTFIRKQQFAKSNESDPKYSDVHYSVNTVEDLKLCEQILAITGEGARWQDHVEAYRKIKNG
jgi:spore coat polysaccharide biosynthesis protein SpsF